MSKYQFSPAARDDLREAHSYYEEELEGLGHEFVVEVGRAIAHIEEAPTRWPEVEVGVRKYRLDRFPFAVMYRAINSRSIQIVAVFDLRRRPGSWRRD